MVRTEAAKGAGVTRAAPPEAQPSGRRNVGQLAATTAVLSVVSLAYNLAFAAIIYRDDLALGLPVGLGIALVAQAVSGVFVAVRSSMRGHFFGPQDTPAIVLAPAAASLAGLGATAVPTVIALAAVSTFAVGLVLWLIGRLGLGGLLRYLPFPVVAGFLGGLGLVLIVSGFEVGIGDDPWLDTRALARWVPALALGTTLIAVRRRFPERSWLTPAITLGAFPLAHLARWVAGLDIAEAQARDLLLGPYDPGLLFRGSEVWRLNAVDWNALAGELTTVAPILVLYPVTILMNLAAIDHQTGADHDTDEGLRINGLANLLVAPLGTSAVGTELGETTLSWRMAGPSRVVAGGTAAVNGAVVVAGGAILGLIPTVVTLGMVFFLGIGFVTDWLIDTRTRLRPAEYGLVVAVAVVIAVFDFSIGVVFGILVAVLLFVVRYSRIGAVRHQLTSARRRSNMQWGDRAEALLDDRGDRSLILELDGFLFFGSAARVVEPVTVRLESEPRLEVLVLDFHRVVGIDSDAALAFEKLAALADSHGTALVLSGLSDADRRRLTLAGGDTPWTDQVHIEPDLDRAMQWAEALLLGDDAEQTASGFEAWLADEIGDDELADRLADHWETQTLEAGEVLIEQGGAGQGLVAIEAGSVSIYRELDRADGARRRVRSLRPGTLFGEMSLYRDGTAVATVEADTDLRVRRLSAAAIERLERDEPDLALALHRLLGRVLVDRIAHADELIEAVLRSRG